MTLSAPPGSLPDHGQIYPSNYQEVKTTMLSWVALLAISVPPSETAATLFSGLHSFGDSLSDLGNTSPATSGALPGAACYNGRHIAGKLLSGLVRMRG